MNKIVLATFLLLNFGYCKPIQESYESMLSNNISKEFSLIDGTKFQISNEETAYLVDGTSSCVPGVFNTKSINIVSGDYNKSAFKVGCTTFKLIDGSKFNVTLLTSKNRIQEEWRIENKEEKISIIRPNGYIVKEIEISELSQDKISNFIEKNCDSSEKLSSNIESCITAQYLESAKELLKNNISNEFAPKH